MEAKGGVIATLPKLIETNFGKAGVNKWLEALPPESKQVFSITVVPSTWYPVDTMLIEPTQKLCDIFYNGSMRGAWESGRFSASEGLKGIYRIFVAISTPYYIIKRASIILPTFYKPSVLKVVDEGKKTVTLHITEFEEPHPVLDARIGGWIERALEICGCREIKIKMTKLMSQGAPYSEYKISWA